MLSHHHHNPAQILSSNPDIDHPKQMINIRRDQLTHVVNQASNVCGLTCSCTREESKYCQLRAAFDSFPGVKKLAKSNWVPGDACPYQTFELEESDLQ